MSSQESRTIAYLISSLLGVTIYSFYVIQQVRAGGFDSTTIPSSWGTAILVLIVGVVVFSIITSILVSIVHTIATSEEEASLSDERDHLITLKSDRVSYTVFGVGFLISMIALAIGLPPLVMFNLIVFSVFGAGIVGYLTQLYLYRRGL